MSAVSAAGIGYTVEGRPLLAGVDLSAAPGEFLAVLGPNGAGKTTLIRLLTGEWRPDTGTIRLLGDEIDRLSLDELARRRAVLPQETVLQFAFRCLEVVLMGRYAQGAGDDDLTIAMAAMEDTDTAHLATRTYPTLSGGEATRVSLARVLAQTTPVLFLDEPTASLDIRHQELVMATMRGLADAGGTVVAVLHDLNIAARFADRIVLLADGAVAAIGTPDEVLREETLERVYRNPVVVVEHPLYGCPLILPRGVAAPPR